MIDLTLTLCIFILLFGVSFGHSAGDICTFKNTEHQGICKNLPDCPSAIKGLQSQQIPQTCGFDNKVPIVCCTKSLKADPITVKTTEPTSTYNSSELPVGEISRQKCEEYGAYVYELRQTPILSVPVNVSVCGIEVTNFLISGIYAASTQFPHQAILGYGEESNKTWFCGGTLISEQFVLTAAHCTNSRIHGEVKWIRLGVLEIDRNDTALVDFNVIEIIRHPQYRQPSMYNDIALLKMDRHVKFNKWIRPACLQTTFEIGNAIKYFATGWGLIEDSTRIRLTKIILNKVTQNQCNLTFTGTHLKRRLSNGIDPETQLCAGRDEKSNNLCQYDNGSPLQIFSSVYCMYNVVGVSSLGISCLGPNSGIYTRVSHYIDWIERNVWP